MSQPAPITPQRLQTAEDDAVGLLRDLIRIDSTNTGHADDTVGEAEAAEYVEAAVREVGYEPERFTTTGARRQGVCAADSGSRPERGGVAAPRTPRRRGRRSPTSGAGPRSRAEESDGLIWGRGAVDMKDMDAMLLAIVRHWARTGMRRRGTSTLHLHPGRGGRRPTGRALDRRQPTRAARTA